MRACAKDPQRAMRTRLYAKPAIGPTHHSPLLTSSAVMPSMASSGMPHRRHIAGRRQAS